MKVIATDHLKEEIADTLQCERDNLKAYDSNTHDKANCEGWVEALEYALGKINQHTEFWSSPGLRVLVGWPESQRIMEHPHAVLVDRLTPNDKKGSEQSTYIVPVNVWNQYKDSYYEKVD